MFPDVSVIILYALFVFPKFYLDYVAVRKLELLMSLMHWGKFYFPICERDKQSLNPSNVNKNPRAVGTLYWWFTWFSTICSSISMMVRNTKNKCISLYFAYVQLQIQSDSTLKYKSAISPCFGGREYKRLG